MRCTRSIPCCIQLVFERASEQSPDTVPGDVILTLRTQEHARFKRQGNDLHMDHVITLKEALLGFSTTVAQLDGRPITIKQEGVTSHGKQAGAVCMAYIGAWHVHVVRTAACLLSSFLSMCMSVSMSISSSEFVKVLKGEGMPHHNFPSDKGDLHVRFSVRFPKQLSGQQQEGTRQGGKGGGFMHVKGVDQR